MRNVNNHIYLSVIICGMYHLNKWACAFIRIMKTPQQGYSQIKYGSLYTQGSPGKQKIQTVNQTKRARNFEQLQDQKIPRKIVSVGRGLIYVSP